jgi:L-lactate dehydrogenase complex protein LldG
MVEGPETMSARDAILGRVRAALTGEADAGPPAIQELWPAGTWDPPPDLFDRFVQELKLVQGEARRYGSMEEARQFLAELRGQLGSPRLAVVDHPECHAAVAGLQSEYLIVVDPAWDRERLANLPVAVLAAEFLLADTGSVVLWTRSSAERLLCYLPTTTIVIAPRHGLVSHLSDMWERLSARAADPAARGEMVIVTGPSRTADIEKKLVLGAHGPKRLIVMMVEG